MPSANTIASVANNTPAVHAEAVTNGANVELTEFSRGLFVGTFGDVIVGMAAAPTVQITFKNVPSGTVLPIGVHTVYGAEAGHTADNIVAIY